MTNAAPSLLIATVDQSAIIKVVGRANFTSSVSFKRLVGELRERGFTAFMLDLSECITMDSTFLGVLAGTALKLSDSSIHANQAGRDGEAYSRRLRLLNPNQRVVELLGDLGISDLFLTIQCDLTTGEAHYRVTDAEVTPSREELSQTCLEAHCLLMDLNPENIPKFKEVAQFLAEDVKKIHSEPKEEAKAESRDSNAPVPRA